MVVPNTLYADVSKEQTFRALLANQYDNNSRKYRLVITNNGVPQTLTQPKTIRFIMKADGESDPYYDYPLTEEWEDGYPILTFTSTMLSKRGIVYFKFIIYEASEVEVLSTRVQKLIIQETFTNRDGIIANDNYDFLTYLISEAIAVKDNTLLKTDLVNDTNQIVPGVAALDAAMGKTIYDGLLFKGNTTSLDDEINKTYEDKAVMHSYDSTVTGTPEDIDGNASTYYLNATTVLQYVRNFSGNCFWRKRTGATITNWVKINSFSGISATDTQGLLGTAGATVTGQALIDEIVDRVATKLLPKVNVVNNQTTNVEGYALDARQGNPTETDSLAYQISSLNSNLDKTNLKANSNFLTVGKTGAQYTTINAAINYAKTYVTKSNRATIFIYEGVYNEEITLNDNPGIDLVGVQGQTIIQCASVYPNAPLYTCGSGYFSGITFQSVGGTTSYAMHFERQGFPAASGETVFFNCRFISDSNATIGVGMGENNIVEFRNCIFISTWTDRKAIYLHNFPTEATSQNIRFINNHINGDITIDDAPSMVGNGVVSSPLSLHFFNNYTEYGSFYFRKTTSETLSYISTDHHNITLYPNSQNNTLIALNRRDYGEFFYGYSKPSIQIPNSGYYDYYIPLKNADKYSIIVSDAVIQGIGNYDINKYSIPLQTVNGFLLRDTDSTGTGAGNYITVNFTILPI